MVDIDYLDTIGRAQSELSNVAASPVGEVVKKFAEQTIQQMKDNLDDSGRVATGGLKQSLSFDFKSEGGTVTIDFIADDYWDFINSGVDGTQNKAGVINQFGKIYSFHDVAQTASDGLTFQESIQLWMASKGIKAEDGNQEGLAFVIMRAVKRKGIRANEFVNDVFTVDAINKFEDEIFEAYRLMLIS